MIRFGVSAAAPLLALGVALAAQAQSLPPGPPIEPACGDWSGMAQIDQGTLRGLPPGPLRWRVGLNPAGWSHQSTTVEVAWTTPDGQVWRQTLFEEIQDGRPVLRVARGRLELRIAYCPRGEDRCRDVTLPYRWDAATHRFAGASRNAQESLASSCAAVPVPAGP